MRVLVTGASGFVGKWATKGLADRGAEVFALSRSAIEPGDAEQVIAADLFNLHFIRDVLKDIRPNMILHLAWNVEHGRFREAPVNVDWVEATVHLARAAVNAGVTRIVGVGTCIEYAVPEHGICDETTTPVVPTTLYAISKNSARQALADLSTQGAFSFAWARMFYLFGPFEDPRRLVPSVCAQLARGAPVRLSSGRAVCDFMDVRDAGTALAALTVSHVEGAVNIGSGRGVAVGEIANQIAHLAGRPELIVDATSPDRSEAPTRIVAATRRLTGEVGHPPPRPLEQGLAEAFAWWRSRAETAA